MNYFAHALPFLDRPYLAAASGVPDMLMVVDRRVRVRSKHVRPWVFDTDPIQAAVARGMLQHFADDDVFHNGQAFAELQAAMTVTIRDALDGDTSLRPRFMSHLLVEVLLDATLANKYPKQLEAYYRIMETIDANRLQKAVNHMAPRPTFHLTSMVEGIRRERFLWDYLDDQRLMFRLNQGLRRVRLKPVPAGFIRNLSAMREEVATRKTDLLIGTPSQSLSTAGNRPPKNEVA